MKFTHHLIAALSYFLLVVFGEVALYYLARSMPLVGEYSMLITVAIFFVLAWVLKLKILAVIIATVLIMLYGILSFYSNFPVYYVGYPSEIGDFMAVIGVKTAYFSLPIIAYLAIARR